MTRGQAILDDNSNYLRCFLGTLNIDELAEMLSEVSCNKCICKSFCDDKYDFETMTCQETVKAWLEVEE